MAGTLFNMAPEMLRKEHSNEKVDVGSGARGSASSLWGFLITSVALFNIQYEYFHVAGSFPFQLYVTSACICRSTLWRF